MCISRFLCVVTTVISLISGWPPAHNLLLRNSFRGKEEEMVKTQDYNMATDFSGRSWISIVLTERQTWRRV